MLQGHYMQISELNNFIVFPTFNNIHTEFLRFFLREEVYETLTYEFILLRHVVDFPINDISQNTVHTT
jgi:hypothetical protein